MNIKIVNVPGNSEKLERDIKALQWQMQQEPDPKSKLIFAETIKFYELELQKIKSGN